VVQSYIPWAELEAMCGNGRKRGMRRKRKTDLHEQFSDENYTIFLRGLSVHYIS
jgi:hypothetical protein